MKIAIEGCAHGELERIYDTLQSLEEKEGFKIDLLICCGDFQSSRNEQDLRCMAVPPKYYNLCTFYKYYNGEKVAPILTIFIGGNHEASNYLQELPYGGWVAPNIYYMGYAGVVNIAGIRIGGLSGIYKAKDYMKGHYETPPYSDSAKRSVYHIRNLEIFRLKQISEPIEIFCSHEWPSGVYNYGDKNQLMRFKPHFIDDISSGQLGNQPTEELLMHLKPKYWFSAHLHCKFAAFIPHDDGEFTKFLALDKCLPKRRFLQIVDVPHNKNQKIQLNYDLEWLTILRRTNHLLSVKNYTTYMPGPNGNEKWNFSPTNEEKTDTLTLFNHDLTIPLNFEKTAPAYQGANYSSTTQQFISQPFPLLNPQTVLFCRKLTVDDPLNLLLNLDKSVDDLSTTTISESSVNYSTFINNESDNDFLSKSKRISLKLPEPIMGIVEEVEPQVSGQGMNDDDDDLKSEEVEEMGEKPPKMFKRRNANIYQNN